jgi:hypothetical protein
MYLNRTTMSSIHAITEHEGEVAAECPIQDRGNEEVTTVPVQRATTTDPTMTIMNNEVVPKPVSRRRRAYISGEVNMDLTTAEVEEDIRFNGERIAQKREGETDKDFNRRRNFASTMQMQVDCDSYDLELEPDYQSGDEQYYSSSGEDSYS